MIQFEKGTDRNTPCYTMLVGEYPHSMRVWISYQTIIAVRLHATGGREECIEARIDYPSATTRRHVREMGIHDFPIVEEDRLQMLIKQGLMEVGLGLIGDHWIPRLEEAA